MSNLSKKKITEKLNQDQIESLVKICPEPSEYDQVKNFEGDVTQLGNAEKFFLVVGEVPRVLNKLRCITLKFQFDSRIAELDQQLQNLISTVLELKTNMKLKEILKVIKIISQLLV